MASWLSSFPRKDTRKKTLLAVYQENDLSDAERYRRRSRNQRSESETVNPGRGSGTLPEKAKHLRPHKGNCEGGQQMRQHKHDADKGKQSYKLDFSIR